ncbi:DUF1543 domain-containing protein [Pedobacter sp. MW01-1-1]|uniref:DUF1543 domain-containing protein n=1 Tax=Pedobacter sp. MW01-1-1 TaxID=3383027 RepID=UPI003FEE6C91
MENLTLFMLLLGCKPSGRHTEQHDIFFGIATDLQDLVPSIFEFWPEAKGNIHIDAWREVKTVGKCRVEVISKEQENIRNQHLFFLNLGGYRKGLFDEAHYKLLFAETNKAAAIKAAKETAFYTHNWEGASAHIDDKYGVDVDDVFEIEEALSPELKSLYQLKISESEELVPDEVHLGYFPIKNGIIRFPKGY